jgi:hypothetical protein
VKITLHITSISIFHLLALLTLTSTLQTSVASVAPLKCGVAMASQTGTAFVKQTLRFIRNVFVLLFRLPNLFGNEQ